ncbi:MAG: NIL domain-containing protein [Spirochaetaceae bacterium]|nr:NIL domain-containing protein [Spirochaetaceae bacterium]
MKERYVLEYASSIVDEPVIYTLVKEFDIRVNILRAEINPGHEGSMLVELEGAEASLARGSEYLARHAVRMTSISQSLGFCSELCVDCGACTGVCFSGCLTIGEPDWKLRVDNEKCIACGLCQKACPLGLFSLKFGE